MEVGDRDESEGEGESEEESHCCLDMQRCMISIEILGRKSGW